MKGKAKARLTFAKPTKLLHPCLLPAASQVPHAVPKESGWLDLAYEAAQELRVSPTPMLWAGIWCLGFGFILFTVSAWHGLIPMLLAGPACL